MTIQEESESLAAVPRRGEQPGTIATGCLFSVASAFVTCVLLFINGSLVLAIINAMSDAGLTIFDNQGLKQFLVFVAPVLMVIVQWMMIDYVRTRFRASKTISPKS